MDKKIITLRNKINKLDADILLLLNKRALLSMDVNQIKKQKKIKVFDPEREKFIRETIKKLNPGPLKSDDTEKIFATIIKACRNLSENS